MFLFLRCLIPSYHSLYPSTLNDSNGTTTSHCTVKSITVVLTVYVRAPHVYGNRECSPPPHHVYVNRECSPPPHHVYGNGERSPPHNVYVNRECSPPPHHVYVNRERSPPPQLLHQLSHHHLICIQSQDEDDQDAIIAEVVLDEPGHRA